jgi:hypothetical protein
MEMGRVAFGGITRGIGNQNLDVVIHGSFRLKLLG